MLSWKLGLKACALYRDGSKLGQPLSTKSDSKKTEQESEESSDSPFIDLGKLTVDELLDELQKRMQSSPDTKLNRQPSRIVERKSPPAKRRGYTLTAKFSGHSPFLRTVYYCDERTCVIFYYSVNEGSPSRFSML